MGMKKWDWIKERNWAREGEEIEVEESRSGILDKGGF